MADELKEKLGPVRPDLFPDYSEWKARRDAEASAGDGAKKKGKKKGGMKNMK